MRVACRRTLPILALFGLLTAIQTVPSAVSWGAEPAANAAVVTTYPQIVRLSYVQGDVRVARGKEAEKLQEQDPGSVTGWEQAAANLPLATGYSLATGTGRAEIEFEDASVVYLGENSVLRFNQLSTTSGVPYTELMLLTGTATMNVQTQLPGEIFRMFTPGDSFTVVYPKKAYLRINSYLDAIAVTPQQNAAWYSPIENAVGRTVAVHNGRPVPKPEMDAAAMVEWDSWVAQRVSARDVELAATMKESGLTEPIPGLAEMSGKGKFFACEPYGTCWEPTEGWTGHKAEGPQVEAPSATASGTERAQAETQPAAPVEREAPSDDQGSAVAAPSLSDTPKGTGKLTKGDAYLASHPGATMWTEDYTVPCVDYAISDLMATDPATGKEVVVDSYFATDSSYPVFAGYPRFGAQLQGGVSLFNFGYGGMFNDGWDWAVCHSGSWIRWRHHYVWVAGTKRHHHPPFRWVKYGREVGFVPLHPRDVAGKIPVNMRDGLFKPTKKGGTVIVQRVNFKEGKQVEPMAAAPKEYRKPMLEPLKIAEVPHANAHWAFNASVAGRGTAIAASTVGKGTATGNSPIARGTMKAGSAVESGVAMRQPGMPITFDRKTQSFSVSRPVTENGRQSTVAVPLGGGGNGYPAARGTVSYGGAQSGTGTSNGGGGARSYSPAPSNNSGSGSTSRPSAPAPSYSPPAQSYSPPAQTYSPPAQSYSPPPAPTYSAPPPSNNGGGASGGSGGASHR
jgi:hypothetical protein